MEFTASQRQRVREAVDLELSLHPQAQLKDLYKNFFQDQFGPGHLITNPQRAFEYLEQEISHSILFDSINFHYLGYNHQFVRINLQLIKNGQLPLNQLFTTFLNSTNQQKSPTIDEWTAIWQNIHQVISHMGLNLPDFELTSSTIESNLMNGIYVGHHSEIYQQSYHPHYRILDTQSTDLLRRQYNL